MQRTSYWLMAAMLAVGAVSAQTPAGQAPAGQAGAPAAPQGRGGGRGGPPVVSPEVNADKAVTLRFRAPNAKEVTLIGELDGKTYPMTKNENGIWAVKIGPLAPDVYNYQFNADGVVTMDPANPSVKLGFGAFPPASMFEIPGDEFDDARDVPHGTVRVETYHSKTPRRAAHAVDLHAARLRARQHALPGVLPAARRRQHRLELDADRPRELHHGQPHRRGQSQADDHRQPARLRAHGRRHRPRAAGDRRDAAAGARRGAGAERRGGPAARRSGGGAFGKDLLEDVIPFVEAKFRTLKDPANRALGGLSMGGGQTVAIGFANTKLFSHLVVMSAGAAKPRTELPRFLQERRRH